MEKDKVRFISQSQTFKSPWNGRKKLINYSNEEKYYKHFIIHGASSSLPAPLITIKVNESIIRGPVNRRRRFVVRVLLLVSHSLLNENRFLWVEEVEMVRKSFVNEKTIAGDEVCGWPGA
jgi:hypothetical protein